ncbi:hypothetical protein GF412_04365 [Candidatus Micrarchaeota archaeon]|nr:hypothetical protein [Candidatus Micrarchaeota archaeon]MBD3418185.1 hypothetical protein [Candidatus Micrarchaeota archaeon]
MKGQYFSFDAIVGASIFILTLVAIFSYWYGVSNSIEQQQSTLAKEAIRIADILYSPTEVPYGTTVNWSDRHIVWDKVGGLCSGDTNAQDALGSEYGVAIYFTDKEGDNECWWYSSNPDEGAVEGEDYIYSNEIYRVRRVGSYLFDDGTTELGYVDIYVYNPYSN